MSLFSELGEAADEVLSDPDLNTADVRIRRVTGYTAGAEPHDDPVEVVEIIKLNTVVFTKDAEFSGGTLTVERGDEITASPWGTLVEQNGNPVNQRVAVEVRPSDEILVDGDVRRIVETVRVPAAGPDVTVWQIRVVD